jgi:hypothetical protein
MTLSPPPQLDNDLLAKRPGSAGRVLSNHGPRSAGKLPAPSADADPVNERGGGMSPGPKVGENLSMKHNKAQHTWHS